VRPPTSGVQPPLPPPYCTPTLVCGVCFSSPSSFFLCFAFTTYASCRLEIPPFLPAAFCRFSSGSPSHPFLFPRPARSVLLVLSLVLLGSRFDDSFDSYSPALSKPTDRRSACLLRIVFDARKLPARIIPLYIPAGTPEPLCNRFLHCRATASACLLCFCSSPYPSASSSTHSRLPHHT
jgi:hypothetical protein